LTSERERLLADVVWVDLARIVEHSWAQARGDGCERIEQAIGDFLDAVAFQSAIRALLASEGAAGLRVLTAPNGPVRPRLVARLSELIAEQVAAGAYRAPGPPSVLAEGVVSLGERLLHDGRDPSLNPDPATAKTVVGLLLREPPA
jgi:hypothetical protein